MTIGYALKIEMTLLKNASELLSLTKNETTIGRPSLFAREI